MAEQKCSSVLIEHWKRVYNTVMPHGSLAYKAPAPEGVMLNNG
jgi:transposase InsO family protein